MKRLLFIALFFLPLLLMAQDRIGLAVLYFDNAGGEANLEKLRKGMADMLITDLSKVSALQVVERARLEEVLKELELAGSKAVDKSTAAKVGKLVGAEVLLTGGLFELLGTLRVDARFIDVETGEVLKSDAVEGPLSSFFDLQKQLTQKALANMEVKLTGDEQGYLDLQIDKKITYETALAFSEALDLMDLGQKAEATARMEKLLSENPEFEPAKNALAQMNKPLETVADGSSELTRGGGDPLKGLNVSKAAEVMKMGKYYALIIGIDNYSGAWTPLKNAVNDAKAVEQLLRNEYKFDAFKTLYNNEATRTNVIKVMEWLVAQAKPDDNVFIYYSGHGEFKKELNKGYWVPVDAKTTSVSDYISNNDIQTFLGGIRSKHTLLVSDACFSGDIFRGNTIDVPFEQSEKYYNTVHALPSRRALTSGGLTPVMDGGRDNHSVFAYYFLKALQSNHNKYFDASELYSTLKVPVVNNSEQKPEFNAIKNTGDEGGQFIFIRNK